MAIRTFDMEGHRVDDGYTDEQHEVVTDTQTPNRTARELTFGGFTAVRNLFFAQLDMATDPADREVLRENLAKFESKHPDLLAQDNVYDL